MSVIKTVIDRFEDNKAVLILANGQQIVIDKGLLDFEAAEGDTIYLTFSLSQEKTGQQEKLAKDILKEILKKDES